MPKSTAVAMPDDERDDAALIEEINSRTQYMLSRWADIRAQGDLNMKALSITGPWPDEEIAARDKPENKRPHGHTDIISQYNNRVVNQWRMNPRGVKIDKAGEGADDQTAELRESRLREIAYQSQAKAARLCAYQNVVDRGYGCWEVYEDYESPRSSRQKLCVGAIQNPNSVLVDPDTAKLDRSDMRYAVKMGKAMPVEEFKKKYKKARDISSFPAEALGMAKAFTDGKTVTPAEYFRVVTQERTLLTLDDGRDVFEDELKPGTAVRVVASRQSECPTVEHYVTNGLEILARKKLPISIIPLIYVVAREKYENDVLTIEALTSKMREPQLNFDLARASEIEAMNQVPKSKWVVSDEQIMGYESQWQNAHRNPQAYLMVHEYDRQGRQMAHPERTDYEPPLQGFEIAANSFVRDVQNTVGMASVERKDRTAKSGIALQQLDETTDIANYHLVDNMIMGVELEGRIENEWIAIIEDSDRTVGLRKPDGKYTTQRITPVEEGGKIKHPYGEAQDHAVTIGTGPDYASQRQEKIEFIKDMIKTPEFVASPVAPLLVHEMELGPGGDKIERVLKAVQPPAVQAAYADDDEERQQVPPEAQAQIAQLEQSLQEAMQALQQVQMELATKKYAVDADARIQSAKLEAETAIRKLELALEQQKIAADLEKARLQSGTTLEKADRDNETKEAIALHQLQHASQEGEASRAHDADQNAQAADLQRETAAAKKAGQ